VPQPMFEHKENKSTSQKFYMKLHPVVQIYLWTVPSPVPCNMPL
jgi:hypothetical protein